MDASFVPASSGQTHVPRFGAGKVTSPDEEYRSNGSSSMSITSVRLTPVGERLTPGTPKGASEPPLSSASITTPPGKPLVPKLNFAKLDPVPQAAPPLPLHDPLGFGTAQQLDEALTHRPATQSTASPHGGAYSGAMTSRINQPKTSVSGSGGHAEPARPAPKTFVPRPPSSSNQQQPFPQSHSRHSSRDGAAEHHQQKQDSAATPGQVMRQSMRSLSDYEQSEILEYQKIYFFGPNAEKLKATPVTGENNHGYDDERGDYLCPVHDHIGYRYEVLGLLGKGSFGQVMKCFDWKSNTMKAIKVIRNKKRFHQQALIEVKILDHLRRLDLDDTNNIVHMTDYFYFRNHLCIAFEALSLNLYDFMKNNNFQGLSLGLIRRFSVQILNSLDFLRKQRIIHCDLKPENILLKSPQKSGIKVIDFGSSCFIDQRMYTYVQSRFYRSPEVLLGLPYDMSVDMWSFACIVAELYMGYPLFPGEHETEQMACIMELLGLPPRDMVENATRRKLFFDSNGIPRVITNSRGKKRRPSSKDMVSVLRCNDPLFISFLVACLQWDPAMRLTPEEAMQHEWITEGSAPPPQRFQPAPVRSLTAGDAKNIGQNSTKVPPVASLLSQAAQVGGPTSGGQLTSRQHYEPANAYGADPGQGRGYMTARTHTHAAAPKARQHANHITASRAQNSQKQQHYRIPGYNGKSQGNASIYQQRQGIKAQHSSISGSNGHLTPRSVRTSSLYNLKPQQQDRQLSSRGRTSSMPAKELPPLGSNGNIIGGTTRKPSYAGRSSYHIQGSRS